MEAIIRKRLSRLLRCHSKTKTVFHPRQFAGTKHLSLSLALLHIVNTLRMMLKFEAPWTRGGAYNRIRYSTLAMELDV